MSTLIALAGPSRSGKGTCATVFASEAQAQSLTVCERQLSGPGKQYVASAFHPEITEEEAIAWFEQLKIMRGTEIAVVNEREDDGGCLGTFTEAKVSLQEYLQRMLQGARERWGEDFWTDKLIPADYQQSFPHSWDQSFPAYVDVDDSVVADVALISDLRQVNEAVRVKAIGGIVIEMRRPQIKNSYITGSGHITEQCLGDLRPDLVDHIIYNDFREHDEASLAALEVLCVDAWDKVVVPRLETT